MAWIDKTSERRYWPLRLQSALDPERVYRSVPLDDRNILKRGQNSPDRPPHPRDEPRPGTWFNLWRDFVCLHEARRALRASAPDVTAASTIEPTVTITNRVKMREPLHRPNTPHHRTRSQFESSYPPSQSPIIQSQSCLPASPTSETSSAPPREAENHIVPHSSMATPNMLKGLSRLVSHRKSPLETQADRLSIGNHRPYDAFSLLV
jgi:hypothetical protein